jgi:hypothetical protein
MTFGGYTVVPDPDWPKMYRVGRPDGSLTDMVNISRARDAARCLAGTTTTRKPPAAQHHAGMKPDPIRAELSGADTCSAHGLTVRAAAPVFALCRKLIEVGQDPATPLEAYRGDILCLTVSSIGWGAKHTVEDNACGTPSLRRFRPRLVSGAASPDASAA